MAMQRFFRETYRKNLSSKNTRLITSKHFTIDEVLN